MKRSAFFLFGWVILSATLLAADQTSDVQTELKQQGFYFGEVDGVSGPALAAALKRYQIRNGLEVTGEVNAETLAALGIAKGGAPATAHSPTPPRAAPPRTVAPQPPPPVTSRREPVDLRKSEETVESDRRVLRETTRRVPSDPSIVPPPADVDRPPSPREASRFTEIYAATPYQSAPPALQEQTLRAAQRLLANQGHYRDAVDGEPGPATEEALLSYQRARRLPMTGRLDLETLNALHLLPGPGSANPGLRPFTAPRGSNRVYRGVWVQ